MIDSAVRDLAFLKAMEIRMQSNRDQVPAFNYENQSKSRCNIVMIVMVRVVARRAWYAGTYGNS